MRCRCLTHWHVNQIYLVLSGPRRHALHSAANARPVPLDSEEEIQTIPGAASRPLQAQDDDSFASPVEVGIVVCVCKHWHSGNASSGHFKRQTFECILNTQIS